MYTYVDYFEGGSNYDKLASLNQAVHSRDGCFKSGPINFKMTLL
jgi:hypothetical protein